MSFFTGSGPSTEVFNYLQKLPKSQRGAFRGVTNAALGVFPDLINKGETDADRALFNASRADTMRQYGQATQNAGQMLNRAGASNSTGAIKSFGQLSEALLGSLTQQDVAREREMMQRRLSAAMNAGQFAGGLASGTSLAQQPGTTGFLQQMAPAAGEAGGLLLAGGLGKLFSPSLGTSVGKIGGNLPSYAPGSSPLVNGFTNLGLA